MTIIKYLTATLAAIVVSLQAFAGTFVVPPAATITGSPDGTVSWSGVELGSVVHFRDVNAPPVEHKVKGSSGSIKLQDVASNGGRIQVRDTNGNWAWLTPSGTRFALAGIHLDCSNHDGCALEVNGTGPKSAPVASYQGGVYQGYPSAQQLASTDQRVAPNNGYAMTTAPSGAVVTPVTMVPPPVMVTGATPSGKYKLVPVVAAETRTWEPAQKAAAEAKKAGMKSAAKVAPAKDECVAGKPIETKDGVVQCIPKLLTRIGDAPKAVEATAAPAAPATPPAAPAPAAPAAAPKKQG